MEKNNSAKPLLIHLGLVALAALLFAGSFPSLLFKNGLPFLAWFAYIPVLVLIRKNGFASCAGWGAVYGLASYWLFNYWLGAFHPLAGTIVYSIYIVYMIAVFLLLKLADVLFPKKAYVVQWLIWLAYEYLRTKGFLGYSYGITGYSQWRMIPLIQIASLTGVWGVSALVTFPSFWLACALKDWREEFTTELHEGSTELHEEKEKNKIKNSVKLRVKLRVLQREEFTTELHEGSTELHEEKEKNKIKNSVKLRVKLRVLRGKSLLKALGETLISFFKKEKIPAIVWTAALCASLVFGIASNKDFSAFPSAQIALIQHNTDPWEASKASSPMLTYEAYRQDLAILKQLSSEALATEPKPQMVVWPETAFVPRIHWHNTYREDRNAWNIVRELLEYLGEQDVPFLIGNDDARSEPEKNPNSGEKFRVDYNAALLFENGKITETYRKLHLVPFTEHFPYQKQLPFIYNTLIKADTHFWERGDVYTVFSGPGFNFSAPICFEDTFGYLSRGFVMRGADVLVNMSNDAWSKSLPAQNQHLSMAVFRAVENYRPMVRSTVSGQTCAIDPQGRVIAMAPPFKEAWIIPKIPLVAGKTLYTHWGDWLGILFAILAAIGLLSRAIQCILRQNKKDER